MILRRLATEDVTAGVRALVDRAGMEQAAETLGVSAVNVERILAGTRVRPSQLALVETALARAALVEAT